MYQADQKLRILKLKNLEGDSEMLHNQYVPFAIVIVGGGALALVFIRLVKWFLDVGFYIIEEAASDFKRIGWLYLLFFVALVAIVGLAVFVLNKLGILQLAMGIVFVIILIGYIFYRKYRKQWMEIYVHVEHLRILRNEYSTLEDQYLGRGFYGLSTPDVGWSTRTWEKLQKNKTEQSEEEEAIEEINRKSRFKIRVKK